MAEHDDSTATILFALGTNVVIALAKGIATWITGSTSMVAEAVHSVADCGNQSLLLLGLNRSARLPNAEYPLGHGRAIKARMTENVSAPVMIEVINGCERALRARMRNLTIRRP